MKWRLVPIALWAAAAVAAAIVMEGFIRQVVIRPLLYTAWVAELFVKSLPQGLYWGLFVLVVLILSLRILGYARPHRGGRQAAARELKGPVAQWQAKLQRAEHLEFARWTLVRALRQLTADIVRGTRTHSTVNEEAESRLQDLDLPPRVADYLDSRTEPESAAWWRTQRWSRLLPQVGPWATEDSPEPEEIVAYLETFTATRDTSE